MYKSKLERNIYIYICKSTKHNRSLIKHKSSTIKLRGPSLILKKSNEDHMKKLLWLRIVLERQTIQIKISCKKHMCQVSLLNFQLCFQ